MLKYTKGACIMQTRYYDNISDKLKDYFAVLSPEFPEWLHEYIDTQKCKELVTLVWIVVVIILICFLNIHGTLI